jgi:hypothetical protein
VQNWVVCGGWLYQTQQQAGLSVGRSYKGSYSNFRYASIMCVCVCTQLSLACEAKFLLICMGSLQLPSLFPRQDAKESSENTYEFHISNTNESWSTPTSNWDPLHSAMAYCWLDPNSNKRRRLQYLGLLFVNYLTPHDATRHDGTFVTLLI